MNLCLIAKGHYVKTIHAVSQWVKFDFKQKISNLAEGENLLWQRKKV